MPIQNALASMAVKDLSVAARWYEELLGRPPDSRPTPEVAEWRFERGGGLQIYHLPERAGAGSVTLAVTSVEEQAPRLQKLGIDTRNRASGAGVSTLMITDPDGNHIAFVEATDSDRSR